MRQKLGQIKGDEKALNRAMRTKTPEFREAFLAAAERILSDEQFIEIELRAMEMLDT